MQSLKFYLTDNFQSSQFDNLCRLKHRRLILVISAPLADVCEIFQQRALAYSDVMLTPRVHCYKMEDFIKPSCEILFKFFTALTNSLFFVLTMLIYFTVFFDSDTGCYFGLEKYREVGFGAS